MSGKKEVLMNRLIRHRAGEITAEGRLKSKKVVAERVRPQVDGSSVIPKTIKMKKFENLWYKKKKSYMNTARRRWLQPFNLVSVVLLLNHPHLTFPPLH